VYSLDLVEAISTIYEIHPVGVAGEDKVVASTGEYVVVALAGEDFVVAGATFDRVVAAETVEAVVPGATVEAVGPFGPHERILAVGADEDLSQASCPVKRAPTITTITVSKMYSRFIGLPPLVYLELVLLAFSLDLINRHWFKASSPQWLADRLCHRRNNSRLGTWRNLTGLPRTPFLLMTVSILAEPVTVERHPTGRRSNSACIQHPGGNT
jgi:hypothetical protein